MHLLHGVHELLGIACVSIQDQKFVSPKLCGNGLMTLITSAVPAQNKRIGINTWALRRMANLIFRLHLNELLTG